MSQCIVCNSVINSNRRGIKYCSNACKQRAYNNRKRGLTATSGESGNPFQTYLNVIELIGEEYYLPFSEFLFIKSCNPFVTSIDEFALLVQKVLEDVYDLNGDIDNVYKQGLNNFMKKWYSRV